MPELTVASTTDTDKDVALAAGATPKPEVEPEKPEQVEGATVEAEPETRPQPSKSKIQKRIDELKREQYQDREKIAELERKLAAATGPKEASTETVEQPTEGEMKPAVRAKPTPSDTKADGTPKYASYEEFTEDLTEWKVEVKLAEREQRDEKARAEQASKDAEAAGIKKYTERIEQAKKDYPDWDDVVTSRNMPIPPAVGKLIVHDLDNGPDVVYYLAEHPEIRTQLNDWAAKGKIERALAEVGRISAALEPSTATEEEEEQEPAPVRRPASKAPAPIRPVGGSSTKSSVPIDDLPYQEYKKIRNQQIKNRYR